MPTVFTKSYAAPPVERREILRYAGARDEDGILAGTLDECLGIALPVLSYRVCFCELAIKSEGTVTDLGFARVASASLAKNLGGCTHVLVLAATLGVELDRMIARYGAISPAKALLLNAIGAERIEALCDAFSADVAREYGARGFVTRPRFSPGYGDLPLTLQRELLSLLDAPKRIGVFLNESLLMTPSKSVTALVGIGE